MHASLTAAGVVSVALFIGCTRPDSPTSPTLDPSRGPSIAKAGGSAIRPAMAGEVVPFKGRVEGASTVTFEPPPSLFFAVLFAGAGNATFLGQFTVEAPHRVNSATGIGIGSFTFTAANGDRLTADFTGTGTPTATPGVFAIVETASITGGTGRFAGATGSFVVERSFDFATLSSSGSFEGTISWPDAGKH
jgi:hypothetical protein